MNIVVIGTGYVGLVSGACLASLGCNVTCVDIDDEKINKLKNGIMPIFEEGLEELVKLEYHNKKLKFSTNLSKSMSNCDAVFIAVGTPSDSEGNADLKYVYQVAKDIAKYMKKKTLVINKSTVPVGTAKEVDRIIKEVNPNAEFCVASNPEFLREGCAVKDFLFPDRVIIGVRSHFAENMLKKIYKNLLNKTNILTMSPESAELTKYAANSFLATKISFINEISQLCEYLGADIESVREGIGSDSRIGLNYLMPGPGYGGSCFPKDTNALSSIAHNAGSELNVVRGAIKANKKHKIFIVNKIKNILHNDIDGKKICILGLTFKSDTDDMRESPSIDIINSLVESGADINAHDPEGICEAKKIFKNRIKYFSKITDAATNCDACIILTDWIQYKKADFSEITKIMKGDIVIDTRNILSSKDINQDIMQYHSLGRPN